ncbi:MAG: hypothetical protein QGG69_07890 [Kiritimatiellia bacterium]|nr:hypothetical protein [Kiritimatiellia bacterium]
MVRIRRPVLIGDNPNILAANADIVVNFGGGSCSSFLVDLDLSSRIDGMFHSSRPGPEYVRARMTKKGDRLVGTFKPYCRVRRADPNSLHSPVWPGAEFRFDVRKRMSRDVESTSRLLSRSASVD